MVQAARQEASTNHVQLIQLQRARDTVEGRWGAPIPSDGRCLTRVGPMEGVCPLKQTGGTERNRTRATAALDMDDALGQEA